MKLIGFISREDTEVYINPEFVAVIEAAPRLNNEPRLVRIGFGNGRSLDFRGEIHIVRDKLLGRLE